MGPLAVSLLQKPLILALELVVEYHALDASTFGPKTFCGAQIRAIELRIVREFSALDQSVIEGLTGFVIRRAVAFEQLTTAVGQDHQLRELLVVSVERCHDANEARRSQPIEVTVPDIGRAPGLIAKVVQRHDPKRADGGERSRFRPSQFVLVVADMDALSFEAPR